MARIPTITVALLCLICILALCIAPAVDIPQTILKSFQMIAMLMLILVTGAFQMADLALLSFPGRSFAMEHLIGMVRSPQPPLATNCVQQC